MPQHPVRNRVIAGAFLLAAMAAAVAVLVLLGGWETWTQETQTLRVRFKAAPNVKVGSPVLLAGHPVGRVEHIAVVEAPCPPGEKRGPCYVVEVAASLPKTYVIHKNARVLTVQSLVGQSAVVNIEDVGFSGPVTDYLPGGEASPFAGAAGEVGIGEKERQSIAQIIEHVRLIAENLKGDLPGIIEKVKAAGDSLAAGAKKADDALAKVNLVLDENRENIKATVAGARSATEKVDKGAGEIVANVKTASEDVQAIVKENREDIRQTVEHLRGTVEKADKDAGEIMANVKAASADIKAAVADFKTIASDGKALVATHRGNVASMLQNFRETSDHLLALAKEVRRAPWRLFATPDKKEVESLNLYDSARAFASAATDIDSCADTLQVMLEARAKGVEVDPEILKGMLQRLQQTFEKYQEAEKALLKEFDRIQK
ncbi:MAG: hypothetical protein FJ288_17515 [Planctomycetes bacterium]|nr:hypothetical protein [Planctomycetota bacterium]